MFACIVSMLECRKRSQGLTNVISLTVVYIIKLHAFIITQAHIVDIYARVCMYTCVC